MPFIRDPLRSLSGSRSRTCFSTCFLESSTTRRAGNNEPGSLSATCDSAKQRRIEQNRHGHRRWSNAERAESPQQKRGRKEDRRRRAR